MNITLAHCISGSCRVAVALLPALPKVIVAAAATAAWRSGVLGKLVETSPKPSVSVLPAPMSTSESLSWTEKRVVEPVTAGRLLAEPVAALLTSTLNVIAFH